MSRESERLEHLISRCLDDECSPQERELLDNLVDHDPQTRALYDEYSNLDRAIGAALHTAMDRVPARPPLRVWWSPAARLATVAAAACLAAMAWVQPFMAAPGSHDARPQQAASWFAPLVPAGDAVQELPLGFERPQLGVRGTQRDWIVIPGREPGSYLVIEVDRVRTHRIAIHRDF